VILDKRRTILLSPGKGGIRVFEPSLSKRPAPSGWFKKEVFEGGGRCKFLIRWTLFQWRGWDLYLHKWVSDDWSEHLHDHSRNMVSVGIWGSYTEHLEGSTKRWRSPWIRLFPAAHRHRVVLNTKRVWTLILAWPNSHYSAFFVNGKRVGPNTYLRSAWADQQKRC